MADRTIMNAKDAVSASLAECFVTIGDNRYNFMQAINLEANFEKNKTEVPILGKTGKGKKINIFKMKPKKGYRRRQGHRQPYTKVTIASIKA